MSAAVLFAVGQTLVFLAVCGFALWSARLTSEAAENSARAAEEAAKAAADVREMRDALRTWLDQERDRAAPAEQPPAPARAGTDTAEVQAVLTPEAVVDGARSSRGRHAQPTTSPWTAALRAATSRSNRDR